MRIEKCCVFICEDVFDQAVFAEALHNVSPETLCFTASNGQDALYMMKEERIIPNYIFVELNMPKMDGLQFLRTIKKIQKLKEVPVIVHSTSPQPHKIIEIKESGALAMYFRPYEYYGICNMLTLYFGSTMATIQQN
jgi:CheY-like chemotaxis protein